MRRTISRRRLLRGAAVALALPLLESMRPPVARARADASPRRMFCICNNLGLLPEHFFPKDTGRDYALSPYLKLLEEHRADFTVLSGVSHPSVDGGHPSDIAFLTAAPHPASSSFRNSISLDQLVAERIGTFTRFPSLTLAVNGGRSLSWTRTGVAIPPEDQASRVFNQLFLQGSPAEIEVQIREIDAGRSVLDVVADQAKDLERNVGTRDRSRLDQYFSSVRDLEHRLQESRGWANKPKPTVKATPPIDPAKGYAAEPPASCQPPGSGRYRGVRHVWNPVDGKQLELSDAPGTLWHLCLTQFFPKYTRITQEETRQHYRYAIRELAELIGHQPTIADLTDDNLAGMVNQTRAKGRAPETINGLVGRLRTLWSWLAKRRLIDTFPTTCNVREPRRVPKAWTREDLGKLLAACEQATGTIGDIPAADFFTALHLLIWDTSERIGAVLAIRRDWVNWQTGDLLIPAEHRKGQERDMQYKLHRDTLAALAKIRDNGSGLLFPIPLHHTTLYHYYKKIRKAAGLPLDRKSAFHRMRRSVASWLTAAGQDATRALGHSDPSVTRRSYIDPAIAGGVKPCDVLFRPGRRDEVMAVTVVKLSAHEARGLPRAKIVAG